LNAAAQVGAPRLLSSFACFRSHVASSGCGAAACARAATATSFGSDIKVRWVRFGVGFACVRREWCRHRRRRSHQNITFAAAFGHAAADVVVDVHWNVVVDDAAVPIERLRGGRRCVVCVDARARFNVVNRVAERSLIGALHPLATPDALVSTATLSFNFSQCSLWCCWVVCVPHASALLTLRSYLCRVWMLWCGAHQIVWFGSGFSPTRRRTMSDNARCVRFVVCGRVAALRLCCCSFRCGVRA